MPIERRHIVAVLGTWHVAAGMTLYVTGLATALDLYVRAAGMLLAHIIAFTLCLAVARDYPPGAVLRKTWLLFAGESLCMGSRALIRLGAIPAGAYQREIGSGLIALGSTFMIGGILLAGYALMRIGFSFRLYRRDAICMSAIAAILPVVILQRWGWPPALDWSAGPPITIFLTAIVSIPLVRFSRQMESAVLAQTNVWIVTYMSVRCFYHLISAMHMSGIGAGGTTEVLRFGIGYGAAWIFAYATALRYDAVRDAGRQLQALHRLRQAA